MGKERNQYNTDYVRNYQRQFMLKVNRKNDPDMVDWLESKESIQAYLKELIRKDMERTSSKDRNLSVAYIQAVVDRADEHGESSLTVGMDTMKIILEMLKD